MDEVVPADGDRVERERRFHDERFTDDSARAAAGKFYELAGAADAWFEHSLEQVPPGSTALEYGSGAGGTSGLRLAERGVRVRGIDISPVAVDQANEAAAAAGLSPDQIGYEVMDAEHLAFPDEAFDLVFGTGILHHLDLGRALPEIARVLRPDGLAVFFEPMGHNPAINLYRRLTPAMRTPDEHPLRVDDFTLARRSFREVDTELHVLSSFAAVPLRRSRRFPAAVDRLTQLDRWAFRRFPVVQRYGWIVVLELRGPRSGSSPSTS